MAWQRPDNHWLAPLIGFVGLDVLAIVFIPNLRPILFAVGIIALIAFVMVACGSYAIGIVRRRVIGDKVSTAEGHGVLTAAMAKDATKECANQGKTP